jgi:hypothetical protein
MGDSMKTASTDMLSQNKVFAWIALATGFILSIPLVMMQFSDEWDWDLSDFIIIGFLIFGMGSMFIFAARKVRSNTARVVIGVAFTLATLYIWAELAVGIFTNLGS